MAIFGPMIRAVDSETPAQVPDRCTPRSSSPTAYDAHGTRTGQPAQTSRADAVAARL
jgi:hypothetical protein